MDDERLHDDLPRPVLPPTLGERLRQLLDERGLSVGRLVVTAVVALGGISAGWWLLRPPPAPVEASIPVETAARSGPTSAPGGAAGAPGESAGSTTTTAATAVVVHAAGAVARPGLYRLRVGARVADVIDAAGGLAPAADGSRINVAAPVADGERVYVLRVGEAAVPDPVGGSGGPVAGGGSTGPGSSVPAGPVDLNTATAEELDTLPGVGPSTAQAIIDYRTEHGRFRSVEDLLDVRGIGDAKLAELRPRVIV